MKKLANLLAIISILLVVCSFLVKFTSQFNIGLGLVRTSPRSGLILAAFLMLMALFIKLSIKEKKDFIKRSISKGKIFFWVSSIVITGSFLGLGASHLLKLSDQRVIERFNQIYYESFEELQKPPKWLGIDSWQNPCDNWMMQEIIYEIKPDFIIETGTACGGTTLFYATVLEKVTENGKVITVDINPRIEEASRFKIFKERVEVIKRDSVSKELINAIGKRVKNRKVLVTLDSLHTKEHVLKELNLYSNFVSLNSYIVVQDTNMNGHPVAADFGEGPMEAVEEFLKTNKNFVIDHNREKFLLTWYSSGYLKRIK